MLIIPYSSKVIKLSFQYYRTKQGWNVYDLKSANSNTNPLDASSYILIREIKNSNKVIQKAPRRSLVLEMHILYVSYLSFSIY